MYTTELLYLPKTPGYSKQIGTFCFAIIVLALFLMTQWAEAAPPVIGNFAIEPSTLEQGKGKGTVTVSVEVTDPDGDLKTNGVRLEQLREGTKAKSVARLKDDGRRGDQVAGDGVFTQQVKISIKEVRDLQLVVSAQDNAKNKTVSTAITLSIIDSQNGPVSTNLTVTPSLLAGDTGRQTVTVSVQVTDPDGDLKTNSIKVQQLREGKKAKNLAKLRDDGKRGDEVAGDGLFSGQFNINTRETGLIRLVVIANDNAGHEATPIEGSLEIREQPQVQSCREQLFAQNIIAADDCLQGIPPGNQEAHFFRSVTRLLRIVEENNNGPNSSVFTDSLKEMLDQFGVAADNRGIFDLMLDGPTTLPSNSPTGGDVQEFLRKVVLPEVTAAVEEDLGSIDDAFATDITSLELAGVGVINEGSVDVDFGDIKFLEAFLSAYKGFLEAFLLAYDLDLDIDDLILLNPIKFQQDVVVANPSLLTLTDDGENRLAQAKTTLSQAIGAYFSGSNFIRNGDDSNQQNDFLTISSADAASEESLRTLFGQIHCSLMGVQFMALTEDTAICEANGIPVIGGEMVDLSQFFDTPFNIRDKLPPFEFSMECNRNFIDTLQPTPTFPFPDPAFNGVFPGVNQDGLIDGLDLSPEIEPIVFFDRLFANPGDTAEGFVVIDSNVTELTPPFQITDVRLEQGSVFSITGLPASFPANPVTRCDDSDSLDLIFDVVFSPQNDGGFTDNLIIQSNDPINPVLTIPVKGCTGDSNDCDNDTIQDNQDNCPDTPNTDQLDSNGNGIGNVCESP